MQNVAAESSQSTNSQDSLSANSQSVATELRSRSRSSKKVAAESSHSRNSQNVTVESSRSVNSQNVATESSRSANSPSAAVESSHSVVLPPTIPAKKPCRPRGVDVTIRYGPYEACGIVDHRLHRLQGIQRKELHFLLVCNRTSILVHYKFVKFSAVFVFFKML